MGFTRDPSLARAVRKFRDLALSRNTVKLSSQRAAKIFLRTAAHYPAIYSLTRRAYYQGQAVVSRVRKIRQRRPSNEPTQTCIAGFPPDWTAADSHAAEWKLPATRLDGALALWNLKHADSFHAARLELARRYHENLAGAKGIARPKIAQSALSHYTVRVNAVVRNQLKDRLCRAGVYTISLWTFPPHLSPQEFPETARVSSEVVNLPLSPWMSVNQVDWVCELLTRCLAECSLG
ncbi:MAG: hypothetical protein EPO07_17435 [Verrucomicrobia bacterium]|nr:MAG: hypothetical protein EPO07_17435 [Verrucomicrobiota bacterium]